MDSKQTKQINLLKELIGLNTLTLFSKDLFPNNSDIKPFIKDIYNLEFKGYLFKSRTLLVARVNKYIVNKLSENEVAEKLRLIKSFYKDRKDETNEDDENKKRRKSKAGDNLTKWLDNI